MSQSRSRSPRSIFLTLIGLTAAVSLPAALAQTTPKTTPRVSTAASPVTPAPAHEPQTAGVERNLKVFDTLDFDVFSNQKWNRLSESHAKNIVVTWPDGHETYGIDAHINDLKALFVFAPDLAIKEHPIRFGSGSFTTATGIMVGTFTKPMPGPNGTVIQPTGKRFALGMVTVGHWKNGTMDHEWLYWDNQDFYTQLGLGK
jgi:SnoaL-like polyketide cyclase